MNRNLLILECRGKKNLCGFFRQNKLIYSKKIYSQKDTLVTTKDFLKACQNDLERYRIDEAAVTIAPGNPKLMEKSLELAMVTLN